MKNYVLIISCVIGITIACSTKKPVSATSAENSVASKNDTIRIANDSLEYEVIIIDPGFNSWLVSRARPRGYYAQSYLENKNRFWVTEWNIRVHNPQHNGDLYQMEIDYKPQTDYGYEVNYLLYNYLVFFQQTHNQKLGGIVPQ